MGMILVLNDSHFIHIPGNGSFKKRPVSKRDYLCGNNNFRGRFLEVMILLNCYLVTHCSL